MRRSAGSVLAFAALVLLACCSVLWQPGIRRAEDGTVHVRSPSCAGHGGDPSGTTLEVQRWNGSTTSWDTIWTERDPIRSSTGDLVIDPAQIGLEPGVKYAVDVDGGGPSRFAGFVLDELPEAGRYDAGSDGEFPNTAAGRAAMDEALCSQDDTDSGAFMVFIGALALVGVVLVAGVIGLVLFLVRVTKPKPPPPPYWPPPPAPF